VPEGPASNTEIVPLREFAVTRSDRLSWLRSAATTAFGRCTGHGGPLQGGPTDTAPPTTNRLTTVTDAVFSAAEALTVTVSGLGGTAVLGLGSMAVLRLGSTNGAV
jgi:hypothetical protein